ncbi:MAG: recombinase family protein [Acidobacteria bacterium]|nr:recombinase family protein [Acidobacteriota bacterium]
MPWAFEAYATGNYSTTALREDLIDRGLTTVPTPKRHAKAPGLSTIQAMLSNPYYKGDVIFRGARYQGLHEPLVSAEVWYRVQNVLTAHQVSGEKTQVHEHCLKGTIYCDDCGSRLMVTHAKNRTGVIYPYFICAGRHSKRTSCTRQAMGVVDIEQKVEDYYRRVQIPEHIVAALRHMLTRQFDDLHAEVRRIEAPSPPSATSSATNDEVSCTPIMRGRAARPAQRGIGPHLAAPHLPRLPHRRLADRVRPGEGSLGGLSGPGRQRPRDLHEPGRLATSHLQPGVLRAHQHLRGRGRRHRGSPARRALRRTVRSRTPGRSTGLLPAATSGVGCSNRACRRFEHPPLVAHRILVGC